MGVFTALLAIALVTHAVADDSRVSATCRLDEDGYADDSHTSLLQKTSSIVKHDAAPTDKKALTIEEVFKESGTDKLWRHGYHRYYETELAKYRDIKDVRIMEIGADSGLSLGAWMKYFKSPAAVHGIAYGVDAVASKKKACSLMPESCDKLELYSMDQSDVKALNNLDEKNPDGWDIIIDDGSHKPQHQLISFQRLWHKIRPGGLYAIEDVETSYVDNGQEIYGYKLHGGIGAKPPESAVEQFKNLVDVVNRKHFGRPDFTVFAGVDHDVARVSFADGIIFVEKKPADPEWDKYPTQLFANKDNTDTQRTYTEYKSKVEPVNKWFEQLSAGASP